jgi:bifunctional DNA-binding transcriptional regulator/antitoxin component of YhaV-PrlF toxin-antitoxin module
MTMKTVMISKGGQISVPAAIRKRWATTRLFLDDRGDEIVLRPAPEDPIAAARGLLKGKLRYTSKELRQMAREDELAAEERKWGRF